MQKLQKGTNSYNNNTNINSSKRQWCVCFGTICMYGVTPFPCLLLRWLLLLGAAAGWASARNPSQP
jgi:hypothetical protein